MHNKTIYMYATLPKKGKSPFGGGEVGNMRTIRMLEGAGYKVIPMRQFKAGAKCGHLMRLVSYPFRIAAGWLCVFARLLPGSRQSIVHLSGFAGATIFNEYVLMHLMKGLGYKVVYELRGGGAVDFWEKGTSAYRRAFRYLLRSACYIFVQGKENIPLIESICNIPVYHYANCVEDGFAPDNLPVKLFDRINLLFYGRCEQNKHIDLIIDAAHLVQREFENVFLTIIGNGEPAYIELILKKLKESLKPDTYQYSCGCEHKDLPLLLKDKHFYIFPSTQPREGQSNSVTECMSYGIVPIASPQGFNRSTIGNDELIVDTLSAKAYADRIINIIKAGRYEQLSRQVYDRFCQNFTQKIVFERSLEVYEKIILGENHE